MSGRGLLVLLVVTGVAVGAAAVASVSRGSALPADLPERLFPRLDDAVNDVAAVRLASDDAEVRFARVDGEWVSPTLDGYPAQFERVKEVILQVAELEPIEAKTDRPELHGRIGVLAPTGDADAAEGAGTLVELSDGSGEVLASVIAGSVASLGAEQATFVRRTDEPRAWLAAGRVAPRLDPMQWVDRDVVRLPREQVQRVDIVPAAGPSVLLYRALRTDREFELLNVPEGRSARGISATRPITTAMGFLRAEGVRRAGDAVPDDAITTTFTTFDGLSVEAVTWVESGEEEVVWAAFAARAPEASEQADVGPAEGAEPMTAAGRARELNEKLGGWWFRLPSFNAEAIRSSMDDMLEPAGAPGDDVPDAGVTGPPVEGPPAP